METNTSNQNIATYEESLQLGDMHWLYCHEFYPDPVLYAYMGIYKGWYRLSKYLDYAKLNELLHPNTHKFIIMDKVSPPKRSVIPLRPADKRTGYYLLCNNNHSIIPAVWFYNSDTDYWLNSSNDHWQRTQCYEIKPAVRMTELGYTLYAP